MCDPDGEVRSRIHAMLGERNELKELYVERLCLCLQRWLRGALPPESSLLKGHFTAARALEEEIERRDPGNKTLDAMRNDGDGRLEPCSHKAFRRYDIIISSIGCGRWRGAMPARGTDGIERADLLASCLAPIDAWLERNVDAPPLGKPDPAKRFLAAFLVSVLRSQELAARKRAESRLTQQRG